jgi:hypothetical protein
LTTLFSAPGASPALGTLFSSAPQTTLAALFSPGNATPLETLFNVNSPTALATVFSSSTPAALATQFSAAPGIQALATLFSSSPAAALATVFSSGNLSALTTLFSSPSSQAALTALFSSSTGAQALATLFANDPAALQQLFVSDPALLTTFLSNNPSLQQQIFTTLALSLLRTYINLPGPGNEVTAGFLGSVTIGSGGLFVQNITPDDLASVTNAVNSNVPLSNYQLNVTSTGGNNVFLGGVLANFTANGGGNNRFVITDPNLMGVSSPALVPAALYQFGSTFNGSGGSDSFYFTASGADSIGNVVLTEPTGTNNTGTLDFSNFLGGGVNINLGASGPQKVNQELTLTLPNGYMATGIGSPGNDSITGNSVNDVIQTAAVDNPDPYALAAVPPSSAIGSDTATPVNPDFPAARPNAVQWVYLNFNQTTPVEATSAGLPSNIATPETLHNNNGLYTAADQAAILSGLENIFAVYTNAAVNTAAANGLTALQNYLSANPNALQGSLLQFTTNQAVAAYGGGANGYETVYFNVTPVMNGTPSPGGESNEIDFRNLNLNTSMVVDVNGFLYQGQPQQGLVPDNTTDWVNLSITVTAHETEHTLGMRHEDAFGPLGFGISNPPGINNYFPTYTGLTGAFTTDDHVIASPASVGSTLADAASGQVEIGEREAVKLAFITNGTVVDGTAGTAASGYTVGAAATQAVTLTLQHETGGTGNNPPPGTTTVIGLTTINAQPVSLYQLNVPNPMTTGFDAGKAFDAAAVDVLGTLSASRPDFYSFQGQAGDLMNFEVMSAALTRNTRPFDSVIYLYDPSGNLVTWNDDQFEPSDSSIVDLTLLMSGTYTVEVDSFKHATTQQPSTGGDYEVFMYRFVAYNANGGNDMLIGGTGNTTFVTGNGNATITGGSGANAVKQVGSANVSLTGSLLTGLGTKNLSNIQTVSQFDNSYTTPHTFTIDSTFTGAVTWIAITNNDSVSVSGNLNASSVLFQGDLAAANITGNVAGPFTVTGILGNFTVGGANGINFNLSAAKITGSVTASDGPITGTIQTTGIRTDKNLVTTPVVADIGTVTGSGSNIGVSTTVSSVGTFTGKLIAGGSGAYAGSIYSTVTTINGGFTGLISAAKDIGAVGHDALGNYAWNANGQVITAGGVTVINGSDSGIISSGGSNYSDPTINGGMSGSVIAGGSILGPWTFNGSFSGVFSAGVDLGAAQRDANNNIVVNSSTKQLVTYGNLTINGGDSGTITVGGNSYDPITINGGLTGHITSSTTTINGQTVNVGSATGGQIIVVGNFVGALVINGGLSGLVAVGGDFGAILLNANGTANVNSSNGLTRYGGFTVNGGISGDVVVLGNVFSDFTVNDGITGRVVVQGKDEYGLNQTLTSSDSYTTANARVGMLGKVTINGQIGSTGALVCAGVIGDDGYEYNPQLAASTNTTGTQVTVSNLSGILAAGEDINGASKVANAQGYFADTAYTFSNKYASGTNIAAIDAIFTHKGQALLFNSVYGGNTGLALILGDAGNLYVNSSGNLAGTVS